MNKNRYIADLHIHTNASPDGRSSLTEIATAAKAAGLHAIAVTDHNLCTPIPPELNGILLIPGCEISTQIGHITALFLEQTLPPEILNELPSPETAITAIHEAGGLAILAHPYQKPGAKPEKFTFSLHNLDGIETANARAWYKVPDANALAARLARQWEIPAIGGSDAHSASEVGNAYTVLTAAELTLPALRSAVLEGGNAVLRRDTSHISKGLSQWTKARRGGIKKLPKAALYLAYCTILDVFS